MVTLSPVAYTHLDVYKRQGQGFLRQGRQAKGQQAVQRTQNNAVQNGVGQHTVQQLGRCV